MMNDAWDGALRGFVRSVRARKVSDRTVAIYKDAATRLVRHLREHCEVLDPAELRRGHIECHQASYAVGRKPSTVSISYRSLQQFTGWLVDEEWVEQDPMAKMKPPVVPETLMPVIKAGFEPRVVTARASREALWSAETVSRLVGSDGRGRGSRLADRILGTEDRYG